MCKENIETLNRLAAIICTHVVIEQLLILHAERDELTIPEDSGWQFLCGLSDHDNPGVAKVWLINEVLEYEPSLSPFIEMPPGTVLTRKDAASKWEVADTNVS